ncbi:MAG: PEGA domain-containing protein [Bacteroidales bacterium]|nr:PEGA domain-containing protein [Bacteroidales bacterium]OJX88059.1 MAG: hypothetical protein BGP01_07160 [Paludibacter sp. 47-17]
MKTSIFQRIIASVLLIAMLSSCASTTLIQTIPSGAKVYIDGSPVGPTPYSLRDSKITGSATSVRIEAEGYETFHTVITKDEEVNVGAIVGGVFFLIPFLWTMQYKPVHTYELQPLKTEASAPATDSKSTAVAEKLRDLKKLLDEGIITQEEFEKAKAKVLGN